MTMTKEETEKALARFINGRQSEQRRLSNKKKG